MKPDFNKPSHLLVGASAMIGLVLLLPKLGDGLDWLAHVVGTTKVAYAGEATAQKVRSDFDRYIEQQAEALKLEKQRNELQEEYNKKLIDIQQQQAPNQAVQTLPLPTVWVEKAPVEGRWVCTDGTTRWWYDETRGCE